MVEEVNYDIDCCIYLYERLSSYNEGQTFFKSLIIKNNNCLLKRLLITTLTFRIVAFWPSLVSTLEYVHPYPTLAQNQHLTVTLKHQNVKL